LGALEHGVGRLLNTALDAANLAILLTHKSGYRSPQRQLGGARATGAPPNSRWTALEHRLKRARDWSTPQLTLGALEHGRSDGS
jgi:hypothetical protein